MKFFKFFYIFFIFLPFLTFTLLKSTTYDGTSTIVYKTANTVLRGSDTANGEVLFKGGITVLGNAGAKLNITTPLFGPIDLRSTGTLDLLNDLVLDSLTTLSNGGIIRGGGHSIFLTGDLSIPASTIFTFTGNTIIDGQGHDLIFGKYAQLVLEGGISVTFRNMVIRDVLSTANIPQIRCVDWYGNVCFDNVIFALNDDFVFRNGQFFIHNDVEFTGTSKFSYRSVRPSYIEQHSNLIFSPNTTFEYYPSSTTKSLIKMMDKTSAIIFDGSTLQSTHTGVRFTTGSIYFDNKVTLSSADNTAFAAFMDLGVGSSAYISGAEAMTVDWSPDGQYIAVSGYAFGTAVPVRIYQWSNETLVLRAATSLPDVRTIKWSPNGKYLAVGGKGSPQVNIYLWDGVQLTRKAQIPVSANYTYTISWHPSGKYLAIGGNDTVLYIYRWKGSSVSLITNTAGLSGEIFEVSWNPSGNYLALVGSMASSLQIYSWNGSTLTQKATYSLGGLGYTVSWSPDGLFLIAGFASGTNVQIFGWNGSSLKQITTSSLSGAVIGVAWGPSGKFIAVCGINTGNQNVLLYDWLGGSISQLAYKVFSGTSPTARKIVWQPDGRYLAVVGWPDASGAGVYTPPYVPLVVYRVDRKFDTSPQGFINGIIFGNSAIGSTQDLDVNLMSGANVQINGQFWYDNAS